MLGAGGEAGFAWEVGLLAGLAERGTDLTAADLVIGTSAGAGVAAAVNSGASLAGLYETQLADLYGGVDGLCHESLRYGATLGRTGYAERYWQGE